MRWVSVRDLRRTFPTIPHRPWGRSSTAGESRSRRRETRCQTSMIAGVSTGDLKPPVLLLAMPQVQDPFFHKSVILLLAHEEEGSFGFIVNRPTEMKVAEVLEGLELGWGGHAESRAFLGGPVQPQLGTVLYGPPPTHAGDSPQVLPGVAITQQLSDLAGLANEPPPAFRLFLG